MFSTLPQSFRKHGIDADVRALLILQKAIGAGLIKTLGDIYNVLKGVLVKEPQKLGVYTKAFYDYFLQIEILPGEHFHDAILRAETFKKWRDDNLDRFGDDVPIEDLVNTFLDEVHLTQYDIKEVLNGLELWNQDSGDVLDEDAQSNPSEAQRRKLEQMADYSGLSLEELLERMREVMENQKGKHSGGSHWIGTGGISPYGHGGAAKDGIRVGGSGGGKMARAVMNDRKFFPVDMDKTLNDNNVDAALASLKGIMEESAQEMLDVNQTIDIGLKRGGLFIPELRSEMNKKLQVLLLIDNGGYSMDPYVRVIRTLFRKMKTRFAHDLETYYFHNTIYDRVFSDAYRSKPVFLEKLLKKNPDYRVFIIGDASMAPYELNSYSVQTYRELNKKFKRTVWLNPEPERYWHHTFSIQVIKELIEMFPMTPRGIEKAVTLMNKGMNKS